MNGIGRAAVAALGTGAAALLTVRLVRSRFALVRVTGASMVPAFEDGERLLVHRTAPVRCGDAVVFRNPLRFGGGDQELHWLVKRVSAMPGDPVPYEVRDAVGAADSAVVPPGSLVVRGDAARTQDSRHFGYIPESAVLGVAIGVPSRRR